MIVILVGGLFKYCPMGRIPGKGHWCERRLVCGSMDADKKSDRETLRIQFPRELLKRIEDYRRRYEKIPPRTAVIRDLIEFALEEKKRKN